MTKEKITTLTEKTKNSHFKSDRLKVIIHSVDK